MLKFNRPHNLRTFSVLKAQSVPFLKIAQTYQSIEHVSGRKIKLNLFQQQLIELDLTNLKHFYRLSTGLLQPKFMNNMESSLYQE